MQKKKTFKKFNKNLKQNIPPTLKSKNTAGLKKTHDAIKRHAITQTAQHIHSAVKCNVVLTRAGSRWASQRKKDCPLFSFVRRSSREKPSSARKQVETTSANIAGRC